MLGSNRLYGSPQPGVWRGVWPKEKQQLLAPEPAVDCRELPVMGQLGTPVVAGEALVSGEREPFLAGGSEGPAQTKGVPVNVSVP